MPTKDELEQENAELRTRIAELESGERDVTSTGRAKIKPQRPVDGDGKPQLTEGERQDLIAAGTTVSAFTGETLNALDELSDEDQEQMPPDARRTAERAKAKAEQVAGNEWPVSGPPPAAGGDTEI